MVNRLCDKLVDFLELAGEAIDKIFLLGSHLVSGQVANVFDLFLQLLRQLVEECVRVSHLLGQILLVPPNVPENFDSKFGKIVFKTNEIALQRLVFLLVRLEVLILLLGDLFSKTYLLESVHEFREEVGVLFLLLLFVCLAPLCLLLLHQVDVLLQLVVTLLQPLYLLLQQPNLLISLILSLPQLAAMEGFIEQSLIPGDGNEPRHHNGFLALLLIAIDLTLRRRRLTFNWRWLELLQDEILVNLVNGVLLGRAVRRHGFDVLQAVEVPIRFTFKLLREPIDCSDLTLQRVLQL